MPRPRDLVIAPLGEGVLILVLAAIGWAARWPLVFASLGPTAYEIVEKPHQPSARPYNVIAGHLVALGCGFFAVWVFGAWTSPHIITAGVVPAARIWATVVACTLTAFGTLAIGAGQPAALSTALLVSIGSMQTGRDAATIVIGVLILDAVGEPLRRARLRQPQDKSP